MKAAEGRLEAYQRLIGITRELASLLDPDTIYKHITQATVDIPGARSAALLLYEAVTGQLVVQEASGPDPLPRYGTFVPLQGSLAGRVLTTGQAVCIGQAGRDASIHSVLELTDGLPASSILAVPLVNQEKTLGVLEVLHQPATDFSETDQELLLNLGAHAAGVIATLQHLPQSDSIAAFVHELRNPLAFINNATYLLLRKEISQEQREELIHNIHFETQQLNTLAASFLEVARFESGRVPFHPTRFKLQLLLEQCQQAVQTKVREAQVSLSILVPQGFPEVRADRDQIKQVILALMSNAIQFNVPGGSVGIHAEDNPEGWSLTVSDTGVGIPEKALPHLFEKFYRVRSTEGKTPGTGLSLAICKQIVAGHGGSLRVKSSPGAGSEFTFHIPTRKE